MNEEFKNQLEKNFLDWLESDGELEFDMHAQDPRDWSWFSQMVPGLIVSSAGGICPFQAEGLLKGYPFYYRERGGVASLQIGPANAKDALEVPALWSSSLDVEEFCTGPAWISIFLNLVERLEKASFLWKFSGWKIIFDDPQDAFSARALETMEDYYGWGNNPEEGYASGREVSSYLSEKGFTAEKQIFLFDLREMNPVPLNSDDRVFPAVDPGFEVKVPEVWRNTEGFIEIPEELWAQ